MSRVEKGSGNAMRNVKKGGNGLKETLSEAAIERQFNACSARMRTASNLRA
jgi:hypothetical protein